MYSGYPIKDSRIVNILNSFAETEFRHLKWLGEQIVDEIQNYDYQNSVIMKNDPPKMFNFDRSDIKISWEKGSDILENLHTVYNRLAEKYSDSDTLEKRMESDEDFYIYRLERLLNQFRDIEINESFIQGPYNYQKVLTLSDDEMNLMLSTLRTQHDKEYKTVLSFYYVLVHTARTEISEIFADLMYESLTHQRHYAKMMASFGILEFPSVIMPKEYQVGNIKEFIMRSIEEEQVEIVELQQIADTVPYMEFQRLVKYVCNQESHHIDLLKKAYELLK